MRIRAGYAQAIALVLAGCLGLASVVIDAARAGGPAAGVSACTSGQVAAAGTCVAVEEAKARIEAIVRAGMAKRGLKAVLAGVAFDGSPFLIEAWGETMTGVPATPDMHFRNGAVAIAYMGIVLLQQRDKGVLDLDDRLSKWFPDYPKADQVTPKMLINGTSGYADYVTDPLFVHRLYADPFRQWTQDELIAVALDRPMPCEPGACWSYAHTNFVILGKVLEKATGRPLQDLIREGILEPLSLNDTRSELTAIIQEPVLHAFDAERGRYEESTYWNPSWTLAHGAIMTSNIADILKSAVAIGEGTLVSPESQAAQLAPETAKFKQWNETTYYGLGVFVTDGWIVQNPSFAGYAATMVYLPARKLAIAVSVTLNEKAPMSGNLSTEVLKEIAAYLAPEAPFKR
jgi:CubicO group peptidase (beta-lactamase class C family)